MDYLIRMKPDQPLTVEKYNSDTGEFESKSIFEDEEALGVMHIFDAEQRILHRIMEIHGYMYDLSGVAHIEYD